MYFLFFNLYLIVQYKSKSFLDFINDFSVKKCPSINGKVIEGNIPGINLSINIKGLNINENKYNPYTLKGLCNRDINEDIYLNKANINLTLYEHENILDFIQRSQNIDINHSSININGPKIRAGGNEQIKINNNSIDNNIENITTIKKQNEYYKNKIKELEDKIIKLELIIKEKDNIINEYNKLKENKNIKNNNNNYINKINELEKELKKYKNYCLLPGEKLFTIKFISIDQKINCEIPAKNTDIFSKLEITLYEKYPKYKDTENYFLVNGKKLNKNRTLEENKIKDNDILTLGVFDE